MIVIVAVVVVFCLVVIVALGIVWQEQDRVLLQPKLDKTLNSYLDRVGTLVNLPHGGKLWKPKHPRDQHRNVLVCHGNAGSINQMEAMVRTVMPMYNVYLLEYHGFGMNYRPDLVPSLPGLVQDLEEAWNGHINDPQNTILMGFSMGGGTIAQFLEKRIDSERLPAQVVLINSFESLRRIATDCVGRLAPWMLKKQNNWHSGPGLQRFLYLRKKYPRPSVSDSNGNSVTRSGSMHREFAPVVLTHAMDDDFIKPHHFQILEKQIHQFADRYLAPGPTKSSSGSSASSSAASKSDLVKRVQLPSGGHESSMFFHARLWLDELLPAALSIS